MDFLHPPKKTGATRARASPNGVSGTGCVCRAFRETLHHGSQNCWPSQQSTLTGQRIPYSNPNATLYPGVLRRAAAHGTRRINCVLTKMSPSPSQRPEPTDFSQKPISRHSHRQMPLPSDFCEKNTKFADSTSTYLALDLRPFTNYPLVFTIVLPF